MQDPPFSSPDYMMAASPRESASIRQTFHNTLQRQLARIRQADALVAEHACASDLVRFFPEGFNRGGCCGFCCSDHRIGRRIAGCFYDGCQAVQDSLVTEGCFPSVDHRCESCVEETGDFFGLEF